MAERRALERLLARDLSGKEIARLTLLAHTEELAGREPTFSEAEIERAKATLRGRPHDIAVYNAWIEASRIVDFVSLEAIANAADAEMRLSIAIGATAQLLRHGTIRAAREMATKVLTPDEWARFPAEREKARRERMAEQRVSPGCRHPLSHLADRLGGSQGQGEGAARVRGGRERVRLSPGRG